MKIIETAPINAIVPTTKIFRTLSTVLYADASRENYSDLYSEDFFGEKCVRE